jgi:thioredoxin reductase
MAQGILQTVIYYKGYIFVQEGSAETSVDGVFAATNVQVSTPFMYCMYYRVAMQLAFQNLD